MSIIPFAQGRIGQGTAITPKLTQTNQITAPETAISPKVVVIASGSIMPILVIYPQL
jgi:phosphotransferase system IIA component